MSLWDWIKGAQQAREAELAAEPEKALRRKALQALALGGAAGLVTLGIPARADAEKEAEKAKEPEEAKPPADGKNAPEPGPKRAWGMAIDLDRCTGCGGCVVACQVENNVPTMGPETSELTRGNFWMDLLQTAEGQYPDLKVELLPVPCMQCEDPPCVKVCPVGATYKTEEGITAQIWDRCIGCRYCQVACPYSRRYFNWAHESFSGTEVQSLNPDVATRPSGIIEKCTFCQHRIRHAKEQARLDEEPLTDGKLRHLTACAQACPARAITFGDLNDPESEVARLHKSPRAMRLLEELGTKPRVVYLRQTKWTE